MIHHSFFPSSFIPFIKWLFPIGYDGSNTEITGSKMERTELFVFFQIISFNIHQWPMYRRFHAVHPTFYSCHILYWAPYTERGIKKNDGKYYKSVKLISEYIDKISRDFMQKYDTLSMMKKMVEQISDDLQCVECSYTYGST